MLEDPLVESLVAAAQQRQCRRRRQLVDERVVQHHASRVQRDHRPLVAQLHGVAAVARAQRRLDHVDAQQHAGAAAERRVVDLAGAERRVVAVVDVRQAVTAGDRRDDVPLALKPSERLRKQREDVDLQS